MHLCNFNALDCHAFQARNDEIHSADYNPAAALNAAALSVASQLNSGSSRPK